MATSVSIDGVSAEIERVADGRIRVRHPASAFNPMHGQATGGEFEYFVHPCQRYQFEKLNGMLPTQEQMSADEATAAARPWWSLSAGERGGLRE